MKADYTTCISQCSDKDYPCLAACSRQYKETLKKCPCNENCPLGCPCPNYNCAVKTTRATTTTATASVTSTTTSTTSSTATPTNSQSTKNSGASTKTPAEKKTVLVLNSSQKKARTPLLVDAEGRNDSNFLMSFGEETEVFKSCSVTYRNRFFVFGGEIRKRQISEVSECKLKRIGTLDFDHYYGACSNVADREIYLCFDAKDYKPVSKHYNQCRLAVDPLGNFTKVANSTFPHRHARTAASTSKF